MGVGKAREETASRRRALIIETLDRHLGRADRPALKEFRERLTHPHFMIAGSDIDGLLSSMMLAAVSEWRIAALVMPNGSVRLAPGFNDLAVLLARYDIFGVDLFSPMFPTISNHPVLFGASPRTRPEWLRQATDEFDAFIELRAAQLGAINLSIWAGIGARLDENSPRGYTYKYPLGTAQLLLAVLEIVGVAPRFYDRDYLPWLVADCDGGLDSIREYYWNVELWWSALAAVVGPASLSEAVYQLARNQRATEFVDVDLRLRRDYRDRASALNSDWNLASDEIDTLSAAASLITEISGWPDPFVGGVPSITKWSELSPSRNVLYLRALTRQDPAVVQAHLAAASRAVHVNFARFFEKGTYLGWMLPAKDPEIEVLLGAPPDVDFIREEPAPTFGQAAFLPDGPAP